MSKSTFPVGVRTSSARCPIAVGGWAPTPSTPGPSSSIQPWCPAAASSARLVQRCPSQPTYWRSSRQMGQSSRGAGYCTPQVTQIGRSTSMTPGIAQAQAVGPGRDTAVVGCGSAFGPVVVRGQRLRHLLPRLEPGRHRGVRPRHYLVMPDVQHPQPALLPEREPDGAPQFHEFRFGEVVPHPRPELVRRLQMPGDRFGVGECRLLPVVVARRCLEVQQFVVLALGQAAGRRRDRALVAAVFALDGTGYVDPAQFLDLMVTYAVPEDVVPGPGEEPEAGGNVRPDRGALRSRGAFARAAFHLGPHLVVHLVQRHVADALLVRHPVLLLAAASSYPAACHTPGVPDLSRIPPRAR